MLKKFEEPKLELVVFSVGDIMTLSDIHNVPDIEGTEGEGDWYCPAPFCRTVDFLKDSHSRGLPLLWAMLAAQMRLKKKKARKKPRKKNNVR